MAGIVVDGRRQVELSQSLQTLTSACLLRGADLYDQVSTSDDARARFVDQPFKDLEAPCSAIEGQPWLVLADADGQLFHVFVSNIWRVTDDEIEHLFCVDRREQIALNEAHTAGNAKFFRVGLGRLQRLRA